MSNVSSAKTWKQSTLEGMELPVPSGHTCRVRRPQGMQVFIEKGVIPNSLMPIVEEALTGKKPDLDALAREAMADPSKLRAITELQDAVVVDVVMEPTVAPIPTFTAQDVEDGNCTEEEVGTLIPFGHEARDDEVLYVDEVDAEDKAFIFQFAVGGTKDIERFRERSAERLAGLEAVPGVGDTT